MTTKWRIVMQSLFIGRIGGIFLISVFAPSLVAEITLPPAENGVHTIRNLSYTDTDNTRQQLDLYLPEHKKDESQPLPLLAFIHGGGWQKGDKKRVAPQALRLLTTGQFAVASIGYRLTDEAHWPAQIHDCKAAIRWLRANAPQFGINAEKIGVMGTSAGGHLVAMLGTSSGVKELEGTLGRHTDTDSSVSCVIDFYGPSALLSMGGFHDRPDSPESKLVGGPIQEHKTTATAASPITFVSSDDAPFLCIHGTRDPLVPFSQSEVLKQKLEGAGVQCLLIPITNGGHGGFRYPEVDELIRTFLLHHLYGLTTMPIQEEPIPSRPPQ